MISKRDVNEALTEEDEIDEQAPIFIYRDAQRHYHTLAIDPNVEPTSILDDIEASSSLGKRIRFTEAEQVRHKSIRDAFNRNASISFFNVCTNISLFLNCAGVILNITALAILQDDDADKCFESSGEILFILGIVLNYVSAAVQLIRSILVRLSNRQFRYYLFSLPGNTGDTSFNWKCESLLSVASSIGFLSAIINLALLIMVSHIDTDVLCSVVKYYGVLGPALAEFIGLYAEDRLNSANTAMSNLYDLLRLKQFESLFEPVQGTTGAGNEPQRRCPWHCQKYQPPQHYWATKIISFNSMTLFREKIIRPIGQSAINLLRSHHEATA